MSERIERLTSLDAARRQLNVAIRLFFEREDMIAVHTLAAAVHGILLPIVKKRNPTGALDSFLNPENPRIVPERRKEYADIIRGAQNFFKHHVPRRTFDFNSDSTAFHIFDCIILLEKLENGPRAPAIVVFEMWFFLKYPNAMAEGGLKQKLFNGRKMDPDNFETFLGAIKLAAKKGQLTSARTDGGR